VSGKLLPYEKYKESGLEWLGVIPQNWKVQPIKQLFKTMSGGTPDSNTPAYYSDDSGIPWIRTTDLTNAIVDNYEIAITVEAMRNSACAMVPKNSVLIAMYGGEGTIGKFGLLKIDATINQALCAILPSSLMTHQFLYFFVQFYRPYWMIGAESSRKDPNISQNLIQNTKFCLPPISVQVVIANYLDTQTIRIDTLIKEQQELIELLREKRQALISQAVTKGIDPKAKMKDSGVEWLGKIPEGWSTKKLKYLCDIQTGDKDTVEADDEGEFPFFVRSQVIEHIASYTADCEAVLTAGDGVGVGKVFHYFNGKFDYHQRVYMMSNFRLVLGKFFYNFLKSEFAKVALEGNAKSTVDSLRMPLFLNFVFSLPPLKEQQSILDLIDDESSKIDTLVSEAESTITLMQEHRSALISAVVTGKVRVPA